MKQTDIYTEALTCLRSILLADHPEFQNQAIAQHLMQGDLQENLDAL